MVYQSEDVKGDARMTAEEDVCGIKNSQHGCCLKVKQMIEERDRGVLRLYERFLAMLDNESNSRGDIMDVVSEEMQNLQKQTMMVEKDKLEQRRKHNDKEFTKAKVELEKDKERVVWTTNEIRQMCLELWDDEFVEFRNKEWVCVDKVQELKSKFRKKYFNFLNPDEFDRFVDEVFGR